MVITVGDGGSEFGGEIVSGAGVFAEARFGCQDFLVAQVVTVEVELAGSEVVDFGSRILRWRIFRLRILGGWIL